MIPVNKPFLPAFEKYTRYLEKVYAKAWLTNNGPMVQELKVRLEDYLGVKNLLPVANGTLAMQLAYKVFSLEGEAVTTPFTFIASSSSLAWEGITPRFADINPKSYNLCPQAAAKLISANTSAIVPVHVYGNPCDVDAFAALGKQHNLKVIYDAAHAFGIKIGQQSVLNFGDASTLSFHATKVFHSVEGGAVIFKNSDDYERAVLMTNFGIDTSTGGIVDNGINTKLSEMHAAMGLAVLDNIDAIMQHRVALFEQYQQQLNEVAAMPQWHGQANTNGAYIPVTFADAAQCSKVLEHLAQQKITARRYFSPSLNTLAQYSANATDSCPLSESLATRTLCLPLYYDLSAEQVSTVTNAVKKAVYGTAD
ncbi:DegT/DnrJ/EryC1/StrS family aminotransferase [Arsukibacterium indicum]|uniref:DegT/DnrJ/EryC1/StrS family aminotransferase n=1 Tax=Arsukibacterium indicum TaxID=2848612 RepID=A0ABS6MG93_9GAMM|nr:DegT/DnrJ/EryC1/StrS family aminotransferase [Arsukibacterium indicum]MBV2127808.1 DegT/DnrJ/EryC1/StrS family aminotransferase [Arsukibacterium indicum]